MQGRKGKMSRQTDQLTCLVWDPQQDVQLPALEGFGKPGEDEAKAPSSAGRAQEAGEAGGRVERPAGVVTVVTGHAHCSPLIANQHFPAESSNQGAAM